MAHPALICVVIKAPVVVHRIFQAFDFHAQLEIRHFVFLVGKELFQFSVEPVDPVPGIEQGRLVHVVPERVDPVFCQCFIFHAEPVPCLVIEKIGHHGIAWPYGADKIGRMVFQLAEIVVLLSFFIHTIAILHFDARIDDRHKMHFMFFHPVNKFLKIRFELLFVQGKVLVVLHVVNVHVQKIERNAVAFERFHHSLEVLLRFVSPAALSVAERELRRHIALSDRMTELAGNVEHILPFKVIQFQVGLAFNVQHIAVCIADVKADTSRIVHEQSECLFS